MNNLSIKSNTIPFDYSPLGTVLSMLTDGPDGGLDYVLKCYNGWFLISDYNLFRGMYVGFLTNTRVSIDIMTSTTTQIGLIRMGVYPREMATSKLDMDAFPPNTRIWIPNKPDEIWIKLISGHYQRVGSDKSYETHFFVDWVAQGAQWQI